MPDPFAAFEKGRLKISEPGEDHLIEVQPGPCASAGVLFVCNPPLDTLIVILLMVEVFSVYTLNIYNTYIYSI